jgi:isocitrate lyase
MPAPEAIVSKIAALVAEAERLQSDPPTPHWEDLTPAEQAEMRAFVSGVLAGVPVAQQHESWFADMVLAGWRYGETYNEAAQTDPDLVHWESYTPERRAELLAASRLVLALSGLV